MADTDLTDIDNLPTDPEEVAKLLRDADEVPETAGSGEKDGEEGAAAEEDEQRPEGVLAKDGRHVIPFEVLQSARDREAEAQRQAQAAAEALAAAKAELDALKAQAATGKPQSQEQADATDAVIAKLDALSSDWPDVATVLKDVIGSVRGTVSGLRDKVAALEAERQRTESDYKSEMVAKVGEAVDRNATLSYWRDKDPAMWERAVAVDQALRNDPGIRDLSFDERFAKVVRAVEAVHGATDLPTEYQPKDKVAESAREIVKGAKAPRPSSLSDIHGGSPPGAGGPDVASMSAAQLAAAWEQMSPEQIERVLLKAG